MRSIDRRHFLKLSLGFGAAISLPGCRTLLERISPLEPTSTPAPTWTPIPTATLTPAPTTTPTTAPSLLPTPAPVQSPLATPPSAESAAASTVAVLPDIQLTPPGGGSKIGLHVVFGARDGLDEFLERCDQAGHPVALVKCVDDFEAAFKAKRVSDKTVTVGRVNAAFPARKTEIDLQAWEPPDSNP